jgi:nicotinamide mononucleotide transporter
MMTRKYFENWILWIIVDVVYIGLFYSRNLALTAVLYTVYLALAILGYIQWKRSYARVLSASS